MRRRVASSLPKALFTASFWGTGIQIAATLACLGAVSASANAATYQVDPNQKEASQTSWQNLEDALHSQKIQGGDTLVLGSGQYGDVVIKGLKFDRPVRIVPKPGADVHFSSLQVTASRNLSFEGLNIWPQKPTPVRKHLIRVSANSSSIEFHSLDVRSVENSTDYLSWSKRTWVANKRPGILMEGDRNAVMNSRFSGLGGAISSTGPRARILGNTIAGFSSDGIRVLGDHSIVSGNVIRDCVKIDDNHDDGIQSWSLGPDQKVGKGTVRGLRLEQNIILEWTGPSNHPLRCALQGIGLFDGLFADLSIQNNVIAVSAYHGIGVAGVRSGRIVHNTLVNPRKVSRKAPWIRVASHKDGRPSHDVLIANNAAPVFSIQNKKQPDIRMSGNYLMVHPVRDLEDPENLDFRPKSGSPLVSSANPQFAPRIDLFGTRRPQGRGPDIGAVEAP